MGNFDLSFWITKFLVFLLSLLSYFPLYFFSITESLGQSQWIQQGNRRTFAITNLSLFVGKENSGSAKGLVWRWRGSQQMPVSYLVESDTD